MVRGGEVYGYMMHADAGDDEHKIVVVLENYYTVVAFVLAMLENCPRLKNNKNSRSKK